MISSILNQDDTDENTPNLFTYYSKEKKFLKQLSSKPQSIYPMRKNVNDEMVPISEVTEPIVIIKSGHLNNQTKRKSIFSEMNKEKQKQLIPNGLLRDKEVQTDLKLNESNEEQLELMKSFIGMKNSQNLRRDSVDEFKELEKHYESILSSARSKKPEKKKTKIYQIGLSKKTEVLKVFSNGDKYQGEISQDKFHGEGKLTKLDGTFYEGGWKKGVKDGKCREFTEKGEVFIGKYKNGKRNGYGCVKYYNGDKYFGYFKEGKFSKFGIFESHKGIRYEGEWYEGFFEGKGSICYANGDKYDGEFKFGRKNGHGTFIWNNGPYYTGEWYNGVRHGHGVHTQASGENVEVYYENGKRLKIVTSLKKAITTYGMENRAKDGIDLKKYGIQYEEEDGVNISDISL